MALIEEEAQSNESNNGGGGGESSNSKEKENLNSQYECNICLDTARDAVISMCGHLFCWPCLHKWLETRPSNQTCPVCKSAISREKVIPLYGRNCTDKKDPRDKVPPRPQGQRTEPTRNANNNFLNGIGLDGLQISFGIGAFPFSFFASSFNFTNDIRIPNPPPGTTQYAEEQILSRIFLIISIIFIIWILLI